MVHPAGRHRSGTLLNGLAYRYNVELGRQPPVRPGVVHRLDRSTSGVILFALHQRALSRLTIEFQQRRVEKRYLALVRGVVEADEGVWDAPIGFDRERFPRWGISSEGRPGVSRFHVLRRLSSHTLLELEPVTGRTNQLRIHAAHFGHPLVGDALFAPAEEEQEQRLFLHAASLRFTDPLTGTAVFLQSPVPEELQAGLQAVERAGAAGEHGSPAAASARPPATLV
jgi:23S rRNA pseudouridine1911/1915/1917 synthase